MLDTGRPWKDLSNSSAEVCEVADSPGDFLVLTAAHCVSRSKAVGEMSTWVLRMRSSGSSLSMRALLLVMGCGL